jgi:hypothetical protein
LVTLYIFHILIKLNCSFVTQQMHPGYVQRDQKVSVHLMITVQEVTVMFKVSPASLQTFIDTRLTLMPSLIHNSNYVIMLSD